MIVSRIAEGVKALARRLVGTVTHVSTRDRVVALTFDDGPHADWTPRLLDVLARHGARATFFMVGESARRHPEIVERVAGAGHAIGNHSWDHPSFPHVSGRERRDQVRACARALEPHGLRLFRPPGGHQTPWSALDVRSLGYEVIGWSIDPMDYTPRPADRIADDVLRELEAGRIILLHDVLFDRPSTDRTATIDAVDRILAAAGPDFEFVTVPELLRRGSPRKINAFWSPAEDPFRRPPARDDPDR